MLKIKSKLEKKKGLTYDELVENIEIVLKEIFSKTYQNLIRGCYFNFKQYPKKKIRVKQLKNYKD